MGIIDSKGNEYGIGVKFIYVMMNLEDMQYNENDGPISVMRENGKEFAMRSLLDKDLKCEDYFVTVKKATDTLSNFQLVIGKFFENNLKLSCTCYFFLKLSTSGTKA